MDVQTFLSAIRNMRLFPQALVEAAAKAGETMETDAQRAGLYTELRALYGQYEELEQKRRRLLLEAIAQINTWRKVELPKLHKEIEDEERATVMAELDSQMSS